MPIDPKAVKWDDTPDPSAVQWDAPAPKSSANNSAFASLITGKPKAEKNPTRKIAESLSGAIPFVGDRFRSGAADLLDAAQHHAMNIPIAIGQLADNAIGSDGAQQRNSQIAKREQNYQAFNGNTPGGYVGATMGEVMPWMTGMGELRAMGVLPALKATRDVAGVLPKVANVAAKAGLLSAEGGLMGIASPVTREGDYATQKAQQVGTGMVAAPLLAAGVHGGASTIRGVGRLGRYLTEGGREAIANERLAGLYGSDPQTLQALRGGAGVPGYELTPAQALATPEAVQTERVLRNNGLTAPAFAAQESSNNLALRNHVAGIAGTDADVAAAKAARKAATEPYYAQLPGQRVDPSSILAQLDSLNNSSLGVRPNIKSAAGSLRSEIESRIGPDGKIGADVLSGLHENAGSHLGPMASAQEKAALGPLRNTIAETLDAAVPGYRANLAAYARTSQPLADMAAGRSLLDAIDSGGRDAGGNQTVSLSQVKALLAKDAKAKYGMSPQARKQLEAVRDTLQQRSVTNNTIAATGPGTAADTMRGGLASPVVQRGISGLAATAGGVVGNVPGALAAFLASEGVVAANNSVTRKLGQKAASAKLSAEAIEAYQRKLAGQQNSLLTNGMPAYLLPYLTR